MRSLSAERDELRGHGQACEPEQAQRQLERALDQERRACWAQSLQPLRSTVRRGRGR
ncbi:hypothetical protein ACIG5E_34925 [Kitasatospora sp. NPDC053057]|uniref:hypothetical protein n=1 Tax=Kitasatospora sp. NPDC053057 TaxID=3364062 RepID=UPI0037CAB254